MDKAQVINCIKRFQESHIQSLQEELANQTSASDIDENDVKDEDAHSHQSQSEVERQRVSDLVQKAMEELEHLNRLGTIKSETVGEGALIETSSLLIHVGIVTQKFTEEGKDIIGISTNAPIYKTLEGQGPGFHFSLAGVDCEILSVS